MTDRFNPFPWEPFCSFEELRADYVGRQLSLEEIAAKWHVSRKRVRTCCIKYGIPRRRQIKRDQRGPKNTSWKGDALTYKGAHLRVARARGKPQRCDRCGTQAAERYEWANLTGQFHDPQDYIRLCIPCHRLHDQRSECRNGHPYMGDNLYLWHNRRYCRECRREYQRAQRRA